MSLLLDAGAFIAVEKQDREVLALIKHERQRGRAPVSHGGVVGQVWRGGRRQASLDRVLGGVDVAAIDDALGRRAGALLARTKTKDVIDAALVLLALDGDLILTSDPEDLVDLASEAGTHVELVRV